MERETRGERGRRKMKSVKSLTGAMDWGIKRTGIIDRKLEIELIL